MGHIVLDTIFGLPLHPLIIHATVVVVPAAALSVLLAALWPRFRRWAGWLPLGLAVAGLVLDPLSTSSGDALEHHLRHTALIERHSQLADGLLPWMLALTVTAAGLVLWHWRGRGGFGSPGRHVSARWLPVTISVLAVVASVGTTVQVVRIGHSGADAAWHGTVSSSSSSTDGG